MNAALRLEKPVEQKDDGIVLVGGVVIVLLLAAWASGDEDHGSPPLSHSHWMLSLLQSTESVRRRVMNDRGGLEHVWLRAGRKPRGTKMKYQLRNGRHGGD